MWTVEDGFLLIYPVDWSFDREQFQQWLPLQTEARILLSEDQRPRQGENSPSLPAVSAPILDVDSATSIGGIYIELQSLLRPWDRRALNSLLPVVQTLAGQTASAIYERQSLQQKQETQRISQELYLAGEIQSSFLLIEFPIPPGWELAVTILPARETSGDYFDIIPLNNGRLGLLIADVADKGVGAALYMAMSRTLIRTYAQEFELDPEIVFFAANSRILTDARAHLFVTAFYGILDPATGTLTYANAGHNPPLLIRSQNSRDVKTLNTTGYPIGVDERAVWRAESLQMDPGDVPVMYTDGIPDAQNTQGEQFDQGRLQEFARSCLGIQAQDIQTRLIQELQDFVGYAPQVDDITLMILARQAQ